MKKLFINGSDCVAGFLAFLVGFTSSVLVIFQAAQNAGANSQEVGSWIFALGIAISMSSIVLSFYYKMPILTGWSTPGAALLVTSMSGVKMSYAISAFIFAACLTLVVSLTGLFEKMVKLIPKSLASAMLAGILMHFSLEAFISFKANMQLVGLMIICYVLGQRFFPKYVILLVLFIGLLDANFQKLVSLPVIDWSWEIPSFTKPVWTSPELDWRTLISIGFPLFIVTMTAQNITGISLLNSLGFKPSPTFVISVVGLFNFLLAPFGCFSIGLAPMSIAICSSTNSKCSTMESYKSVLIAAFFWFLIAIFGITVVSIFTIFPKILVVTIAGLALLNVIGSSLSQAFSNQQEREAAVITLLITISGISILGIAAPFWGLICGLLIQIILHFKAPPESSSRVAS